MEHTIVILMILLIIIQIISVGLGLNFASKESEIKHFKHRLQSAIEYKGSDGIKFMAYLTTVCIRFAIIYYATTVILSFV